MYEQQQQQLQQHTQKNLNQNIRLWQKKSSYAALLSEEVKFLCEIYLNYYYFYYYSIDCFDDLRV